MWACECSTLLVPFKVKFCAAATARYFTFALSSFSHDSLRDWPFWVRGSDRSIVAIIGPFQRPHLTCLIELSRIENGTIVSNICLALIMELIQRSAPITLNGQIIVHGVCRETVQCPASAHRFLALRSGSTHPWDALVHVVHLQPAYLIDLCAPLYLGTEFLVSSKNTRAHLNSRL